MLKKMLLRCTYKLHTSVLQCIDAIGEIDFGTLFAKTSCAFLTASFCVSFLGTDVTIVAHSLGVQKAIEGAEELVKEGISCEVSLNTYSHF